MKDAHEREESFDYDDEVADSPGDLPMQYGSELTGESRNFMSESEHSMQTSLDMNRMSASQRSFKGKRKISTKKPRMEPVQGAGCCAGGKKCVIF